MLLTHIGIIQSYSISCSAFCSWLDRISKIATKDIFVLLCLVWVCWLLSSKKRIGFPWNILVLFKWKPFFSLHEATLTLVRNCLFRTLGKYLICSIGQKIQNHSKKIKYFRNAKKSDNKDFSCA